MPVAISNLSATWSNSNIAFTAISMNVANNGSNADSRLLDLKVDGISKQYTTPNGDIYITGFYHGDGSMLTGIIAGGGATDNIARLIANTAYDKANSANILAFQVGGAVTIANTIASAAFDKANAANVLAFNSGAGSNTYLLATIAGANAAVGAGANAFATAAAAGANAYMIAVQNGANTAVGTGANAFTSATIAGANTAVGTGANTYLLATLSGANTAVGTGANTYLITTLSGANTAVGTGANAFTSATIAGANTAVGTGANTYLLATMAGANTAVGGGANAFATAAAAGANAFMIAVQAGSNTAVGTGANAFTSATIAGANTAVGTGANTYLLTTLSGANTAVGAGANTYLLATIAGANTAVGLGANNYSNATFLKLTAAAQTLTGNLNIVGDLTLSGNTVFIDATRLQIDDPLIYLAGNNYTSDIVDIGFIGNYVNATGANVHTGLYREHTDKMYYLFQGYDKEPENNHIGALSNNMTLAVLNADIRTSNLSLGGVNALITITSAFDKANAANLLAFNTGSGSNTYILATIAGANAAVGAGANAFSAATIAGANTAVGAGANAYANLVWSRSNTFTSATIAGANTAVGGGANAFTSATIAGANTAVGTGANTYLLATIAGANTAVGTGANTVAIAAFAKANSTTYTSNVVISVADNTNAALRITQTGTGEAIRVEDSTNPDATPFVITASGEVGVGTATPFPLTTTFISSRDPLIASDGSYYGGGAYWDGGTWRSTVSSQGGWVIRNTSGQFALWTGYNSGAANTVPPVFTERLRVDGNGNVGIGTTAPSSKLEVSGNVVNSLSDLGTGDSATITITNTNVGSLNRIAKTLYEIGNLPVASVAAAYTVFNAGGNIGGDLIFSTQRHLGTGVQERMRVDSNGNVGIGTTSPAYKLDVNGAVNASALLVNGAAIESGISTGKAIAMAIVFG